MLGWKIPFRDITQDAAIYCPREHFQLQHGIFSVCTLTNLSALLLLLGLTGIRTN